jgi:hypothetical protein
MQDLIKEIKKKVQHFNSLENFFEQVFYYRFSIFDLDDFL